MSKVLLVEDDPSVAKALQIRLLSEGLEVIHVSDAITAKASAIHQIPALILLDISMPGGNGLDVAEFVRNNEKLKHVPIIFITATSCREVIEKAKKLGRAYYFSKPLPDGELMNTVRNILY